MGPTMIPCKEMDLEPNSTPKTSSWEEDCSNPFTKTIHPFFIQFGTLQQSALLQQKDYYNTQEHEQLLDIKTQIRPSRPLKDFYFWILPFSWRNFGIMDDQEKKQELKHNCEPWCKRKISNNASGNNLQALLIIQLIKDLKFAYWSNETCLW